MLPLRQKTEFGTLREVVLGRTDHAAFPPKSKANANFTNHIEDLGPAFYDKYEEGELIPIKDAKPELIEAYDKMQDDLTAAYESEGVAVQRVSVPSPEILSYFGYRPHGYWPFTIANFWQIFGNVVVETSLSDNILGCAIAAFTGRDILMDRFANDPDAIWLSTPPALPWNPSVGAGPGPFIGMGDVRLVDEKNVLVGVALDPDNDEPASSNPLGIEIFKRMLEPHGYNVLEVEFHAKFSFHFDYVLGLCAPGVAVCPDDVFVHGRPEPLKDWDLIHMTRDECAIHGAGNLVPLGPDASGQHRVVVPAKVPRIHEELDKRGIKPIPIECELGARNGGGIRCATLALNRDD